MTKEYLESILTEYGVAFTDSLADRLLKEFEPSNDMVSRGVFEQVMWERDVAIEQLKELGYELGQKVEPCDNAVSRQVAIEAFQIFREYESNRSNKEWVNRIETVLNQLPPVNPQQPCNDAISRETVKIEYKRRIESSLKDESRGLDLTHLADCTRFNEFIDSIPTVKPQYTEDEIQKMQDLEQAEIEKAYELGKVEKQECEDTISRQAVNTLIDELARAISDERCCISRGRSTATIMRDILHLPPFIPQPKVGRWIYGEDNSGTGRDGWYCNQCGHFEFWDYSSDMKSAELNLPNLCPNCKAKMQEVEE